MKSVWLEIYESYRRVGGNISTLVAISIAVLGFFLTGLEKIHVGWFILSGIIALFSGSVLIDFAVRSYAASKRSLPSVKSSANPGKPYSDAYALLIVEPSDMFGQNSVVSIYEKKNDFEKLVGTGYVLTVQEDGLIQVLVIDSHTGNSSDLWDDVKSKKVDVLGSLMVKPTIPKTAYNL